MTSSGNASGIPAVDRVIHSLYIVQRPLEEDILRSAKALATNSGGKLTEEEKLHCGVRSIDEVDHYRHDYHVAPDSRNNFVFIQKALANTVRILKTGNKKPQKFPNPLEKVGQVYMSADEIRRRANQLLKKFNGPQQQDDASSFPLGGGFNALNLNSQHFAAYLVMTLCREVDKDTLIQLVWGDIQGSQKRERISKQLEAIAKDINIPLEDAALQSPSLVEHEPLTDTYPQLSTPSPSLASASASTVSPTPTANYMKPPSNGNNRSNHSLFLSLAVLFMLILWVTNEVKSILRRILRVDDK